MDSEHQHRYLTRSKGSLSEQEKKEKKQHTPALKTVNLNNINNDKEEKYIISNEIDVPSLLTKILCKSFLNIDVSEINNDSEDEDEDEDEDYEPIEGIPEEIEYEEKEEEYLRKIGEKERKLIFDNEKKLIDFSSNEIPQRFKILNSSLSIQTKSKLISKLEYYEELDESDNEYFKLSQWFNNLNRIPFDIYKKNIVTINDSKKKIINYLQQIKISLDESVFGHNIAKNQIIQIMGQQISNPYSKGCCIAIQGPPGNGKTTLIKEGIARSINRPFGFIPLGGMNGSDFLVGHDYTYEGSKCGRIIEILQQSECMNPIIYFDELDKLSECSKGNEIENLLCHLTDFSQNNSFTDKYFSGIEFDLSKAIFVFAYNDESKINPILLDRMNKINTDGFDTKSKLNIAKNYLLPKICKDMGFKIEDIIIEDCIFETIINQYTENEKGVRNLKRCLETIVSKLNILKLINIDNNLKEEEINNIEMIVEEVLDNIIEDALNENKKNTKLVDFEINNFKLPLTITNKILSKLITVQSNKNSNFMMYI